MEAEIDSNQPQALKLCNKFVKLYQKYKPLRNDVNKIEQRFGTSVASYFHFYQWMFLNSIIVWLKRPMDVPSKALEPKPTTKSASMVLSLYPYDLYKA